MKPYVYIKKTHISIWSSTVLYFFECIKSGFKRKNPCANCCFCVLATSHGQGRNRLVGISHLFEWVFVLKTPLLFIVQRAVRFLNLGCRGGLNLLCIHILSPETEKKLYIMFSNRKLCDHFIRGIDKSIQTKPFEKLKKKLNSLHE